MDRRSARASSGAAQVRTAVAGAQRFSAPFRYGFAVLVTLAALLLKLALGPIILPSLYVPFYGAVLLSAWVGGVGPGIVASVLSFGLGQLLFVPPPGSQTVVMELAIVRDALFLIVAIGLSWGTAALRGAQRRVAEVLLEAHNELEAQVAVRTAEQQAANRRLHQGEERLKEAERLAHLGAWERDVTSNEAIWSEEQFRIFGLEPSASPLPYDAMLAAILPEDRDAVVQAFQTALAGAGPFDVEFRIQRPQGEIRDVHSRAEIRRDAAGRALRMVGTALDITERKRAATLLEKRVAERTAELREEIRQRQDVEAALRDSEQQFRTMFEQAAVGMTMVDSRGHWIMVNDRLCQMLGYSREELMQRAFLDITHEEDRAASLELVAQLAAGKAETFATEKRYVHKDGSVVWGSITVSAVRNAEGRFRYGVVVVEDISAGKRAERELTEANQRIVSILEDISGGFVALDQDWRFTYINPTAAGLLERPAADLMGKHFWTEIPGLVGSIFQEQYYRVMNERVTVEFEAYYPPLNRWYRARGYPAGLGICVLFEDVTETHEQEVATLSDILRALNAELDVVAAFPRVAASLRALTQCERSNLIFFDPDYEGATVIALSDVRLDMGPGTRLQMRDIPAATNVIAGRTHFVSDLGIEPQSPIVRSTYADGFRSLMCLPLRGTERILGMLTLAWRKVDAIDRAQVPLLHQIADAVALATEKSRLFEEVRAGRERLETLSHRLLEIQEAERQHIARELHDEIGQTLTALKLSLDAIVADPLGAAGGALSETRRQVNELLARVRNLALDLRPAMLDDLGLLPALLWLFERYAMQTGVQVSIEHRGLEQRFSPEVEITAYRIVQEALTNVVRHASVQQVTVRAWSDARTLCVQIVDQGAGFDAEAALAAGVTSGVTGMRERAVLLGGCLTVQSARGRGTRVHAELPVDGVAREATNAVGAWL